MNATKMKRGLKYCLVAFVGACAVGLCTAAYSFASGDDFKLGRNIELLVNMIRGITLYYVDPVDADDLGKRAAAGMVSALDPYTELLHADDMQQFELMTTGKYGGIGSLIRARGEWVQIAEPYRGSPADRAGLEIGDQFVEIDGRSARGMTTAEVSAALKGEPGTRVRVRVRKFYTGETKTLDIRREVIALPSVPYHGMAAGGVGYILHTEFTEGCADAFRSAFEDLRSQGARALVLDYRSNGGGILQEAVKILSMFVPKGTEVVSIRGRDEDSGNLYRSETEPLDTEIPIVVLVSGYTASAAEIVAGALQDLDRGVVIGQRTFGKGLVQSTLPLGYNSQLKITTAKYYIPSGRCIQAIDYSSRSETGGVGTVPDSLIREFRTAGGRRVYDGGGVMPDVRLPAEYSSRFAVVAYNKGYIDDFADQWSLANREREFSAGTFTLTERDWEEFASFMKDKDLDYQSATGQALEAVKTNAERERYMNDGVRDLLSQLEAALADDDNEANLALYRPELSELVEDAIILRRFYAGGVAQHSLARDGEVARAVDVLGDGELYRRILTEQDTERK